MLSDLVREAPFGQLARLITGNKVFRYPEEKEDFVVPKLYDSDRSPESNSIDASKTDKETNGKSDVDKSDGIGAEHTFAPIHAAHEAKDLEGDGELRRVHTLPYTNERLSLERELALEKTKSISIAPTRTADGQLLVDWYTTDDPANPLNWPLWEKCFVAIQVDLYTFVVYAGSAIYVSSILGVMADFNTGVTEASLGLGLYVLGYGLGPLLWAPMSEIPTFGRNVPYVASFAIYLILSVPTALVNNLPGLLILRFLQGFFGSPCLANGGATMGDMFSLLYLPYSMAFWVSAAFAAPALGPMLSGFSVVAKDWHWSLWEIVWMAAPVFILWFFFLPETSSSNILLRRSARLRKLTGKTNILSQGEIDRKGLKSSAIIWDAVIKPMEISFKDPAVAFTNGYTSLTYGIYYSFFEVFPLVYGPIYGFNLGETGVVFVCIVVGCLLAMIIYFSYLHFLLIPDIKKNGLQVQEWRLRPALLAVFMLPVGLFLFGWSANEKVHWIVGVIGITIFACFVYIVLQCVFVYIPMSYPQYAASIFAANDFFRAAFAFAAILFSRPMFHHLGIGQGVSLLAGLSFLGVIGIWLLYFYGAKLRARSTFAIS